MKKLLTVLRPAFGALITFGLLYLIAEWIFTALYAAKDYSGTPIFLPALLALLLLLPFLYSTSRLLILLSRDMRWGEETTIREKLRVWFHLPQAWVIIGIFLILPYSFSAIPSLFPTMAEAGKVYLFSRLLCPLFFLAHILGLITGFTYRKKYPYKKQDDRRSPEIAFVVHTSKYALIYALGGIFCGFLYGAATSLPALAYVILVALLSSPAVVIIVLLFFGLRALNAMRKRRKFLKDFEKICEERHLRMPRIEAPYRSLFRMRDGADFVLLLNGKKYTCKLLSTMRPYMLHRISPDGTVARVHRIFLRFHAATRYGFNGHTTYREGVELGETRSSFAFEGEGTKIVIYNPCPKVAQGVSQTGLFNLDNGLFVGKYKFYTGTGFCNALSRDCLDR